MEICFFTFQSSPEVFIVALTSITEALTQLNSNLIWEGSTVKTKAFLEAVRYLLFNRPQQSSHGAANMSWADLKDLEEKATKHLDKIDGPTSRARYTRGRALR